MDELSKLYSPSCWSKRLSPDKILTHHLNFIQNESDKLPKHIKIDEDLSYGLTERTKIDIIGTDLEHSAPILVFIHGGYWQIREITRKSYRFLAKFLHQHNIKTIFLGYDICPDVSLFEIVKQTEHGVKKCLQYAKEQKSKGLYLVGHSAGGHLVANLFTNFIKTLTTIEQELIRAAIPISGVFDLLPIQKTTINIPLKLDENEALDLSPYHRSISKGVNTKFFIIVGENESPEFIRQSKEFHEKLVNVDRIESCLSIVPNVDHFDIIENLNDVDYELVKRLLDIISI